MTGQAQKPKSRTRSPEAPSRDQHWIKLEDVLMIPGWFVKRVALWLLPTSWLLAYADFEGSVMSRTAHKRHRIKRAMAAILGKSENDPSVGETCKKHLQFLRRYAVLRAMREPRRYAGNRGEIIGEDYLRDALRQNHGAILLTAHFGYDKSIKPVLEAKGYVCRPLGGKSISPHERLSKAGELLHHKVLRLPSFYRTDMVDIAAGLNARPVVDALRKNELVQIAFDGGNSVGRLRAKAFGREMRFALGPIGVARRTGAVLLPAFGVHPSAPGACAAVLVMPPLKVVDEAGAALSSEAIVAQVAAAYEEVATAYPHLVDWKRFTGILNREKRRKKGGDSLLGPGTDAGLENGPED